MKPIPVRQTKLFNRAKILLSAQSFLLFLSSRPIYAWSHPGNDPDPAPLQDIEVIYKNIINIAVRLAGTVVFILIIVSGYKYLTAGGNPKTTEQAKQTLTYAIIGLVVLISAWFILRFIQTFTGVNDIIRFEMPH